MPKALAVSKHRVSPGGFCHSFRPALFCTQVCLYLILDLTEHTPCLLGRAIACELVFSRVLETWGSCCTLPTLLPPALCVCGFLWKSSGEQSEFREVIVLLSPTTQSTWITLVLLCEKEGSASSSSYHAMPCPCVPRASCDSPLTYSDLQLLLCPLPLFVLVPWVLVCFSKPT